MIEILPFVPVAAAFIAAALTLMSGFGLGTILTPVFLLFFDVKIAILIVAVVHLLNNLMKVSLFAKHLQFDILKRFGVLSLAGACTGAYLQGMLDSSGVKVLLGIILVILGLRELTWLGKNLRIPRQVDFVGGFFSGLLGGFVGNQGAIRSAYLLNYSVSKETFIVSAAAIASAVDIARIPVYIFNNTGILHSHGTLILLTTASAYAGTFAGKKILQKVSLEVFKVYISIMIIVIGTLLGLGFM